MSWASGARAAPDGPGVYAFLDPTGELLYVGKAARLRRRLRDHERAARAGGGGPGRLRRLYELAHEVRWEETADGGEPDRAALREADLIVALRPRFNASHRDEGRWSYVVLTDTPRGRQFTLSTAPGPGRAFGCFPHLGRGVGSPAGIACSDGYAALLRLLWAASAGERSTMPSGITRSAPDQAVVDVDPVLRRPLHDLLSGTSARLLAELSERHRAAPPLLRPGLARDHVATQAFFDCGPKALRRLRRTHGAPAGPLSRTDIETMVADGLRAAIGPFRLPAPDASAAATQLQRRARPWA